MTPTDPLAADDETLAELGQRELTAEAICGECDQLAVQAVAIAHKRGRALRAAMKELEWMGAHREALARIREILGGAE